MLLGCNSILQTVVILCIYAQLSDEEYWLILNRCPRRQSCCELEVDACIDDVLNRMEVCWEGQGTICNKDIILARMSSMRWKTGSFLFVECIS